MSSTFHSVIFIDKKEIARNTFCFVFSVAEKTFAFSPGQFVTLCLKVKGKEETRDFSIASSPTNPQEIMIVTKKGVSDFKKALFSLKKEAVVGMTSPSGGFLLERDDNIPQVFIAGGIGITPFYSLLQWAYDTNSDKHRTLFVSFSTHADITFYQELRYIEKRLKKTKVIITISRQEENWKGEKGRLSESHLTKHITDILQPIYYVVGKLEMVDDIVALLHRIGVPEEKIKIEYFTGY